MQQAGWGEVQEALNQYNKALKNFINYHGYNSDVGSSHSVFFFVYNNIIPLMLHYFRVKYPDIIFKTTIFDGRTLDIICNKEGYILQLSIYYDELKDFNLYKLADEDKSRFKLFRLYVKIMLDLLEFDISE